MMLLAPIVLGAALAGEFRSAFPTADAPPRASFAGAFDAPPAEHWVVTLPGAQSSAAAQTERARPVLTEHLVLVGSATGHALYALDRATGNVVRSFPGAASVDAAPVVAGPFVFFADSGGRVWSYDLDGTERWSYDAAAPILTAPTLHDGTLYVVTVDDLVVALDADAGSMRWRHQHRGDLGRKVDLALYAAPRAVVAGDQLLVGFSDGTLTALGLGTGDAAWQARVGEGRYPDLVADPLAWEGLVFASGFEEPLVALDPATRQIAWTQPYGSAAAPTLVEGADGPLLVHPGTNGTLRAVQPRSGEEVWTWESGTDGALTEAVATPAGLLVGSSVGTLTLVDPKDGATLWSYQPPHLMEGLSAAPAVDGRQLVFVTNAGHLYSMVVPEHGPRPPKATKPRKRRAR